MNQLSLEKKTTVIQCLVEGNSIRGTSRITSVAKNTILKLLVRVGEACKAYSDLNLRNIHAKRIECDEIWTFCHSKEKNIPQGMKRRGKGSMWVWVGLDPDTKLVIAWRVSKRNNLNARVFVRDLASRVERNDRLQLTTDGFVPYLDPIEKHFGGEIDYSMLVKSFGFYNGEEKRYSGSPMVSLQTIKISGSPDRKYVSTSHVERQNLTMRMNMRRFTRLTNGFSKKLENLSCAVSLHFFYYNFCRIHQSLRVTPAMEAKVTSHLWTLEDLLGLMDNREKGVTNGKEQK